MKVYIGKPGNSRDFLKAAYRKEFDKDVDTSEIEVAPRGKPYFKDKRLPFFNISHSGEYIVCVFDDNEIGIDIQKITKVSDRVAKRYLKTDRSDPESRITEWTRLESYGKRSGNGLLEEGDYSEGSYITTDQPEGYIITVCTENAADQTLELVFI